MEDDLDALGLLAADVLELEAETARLRREVQLYRLMVSESLAYTHELLRELAMVTGRV